MISGQCRQICGAGQTYNPDTNSCKCGQGLALLPNGQCGSCPVNSALNPDTGKCQSCSNNQIYQNGYCVCRDGLGLVGLFDCVNCPSVGAILKDGYCLTCPANKQWQGGVCVCKPGFTTQPDGSCVQSCVGAGCNLNQCPAGSYRSPSGSCLPCPVTCLSCISAQRCTSCRNPSFVINNGVCVAPQQIPVCGNGVVESGEQCDDRNRLSGDGCDMQCKVENGYTCTGSPSVCVPSVNALCGNGLPNPGEACDDGNTWSNDGCSSTCRVEPGYTCTQATQSRPSSCAILPPSTGMSVLMVNSNSINVMVQLYIDHAFTFSSENEMTSFLQYTIPEAYKPASGYCRLRAGTTQNFDCLFNYPGNTIPNDPFNIEFRYSKDGINGFAVANIDITKSSFATRSLS